jgi:hypothetical protein
MKNLFYINLLIALFACQQKEKMSAKEKHKNNVVAWSEDLENQIGFKQLDSIALLEILFEAEYDPKVRAAKWTPTLGEKFKMSRKIDTIPFEVTYTKLDTIYYPETNVAFAIFQTNIDIGKPSIVGACHGCGSIYSLAKFEKDTNQIWHLSHFDKNVGDFGNYAVTGKTRLIEIGKYKTEQKISSIWAISIPNFKEFNYTGGGFESETWFTPTYNDGFAKILDYNIELDKGDDSPILPEGETYKTKLEMDTKISIKEYTNYYDIYLHKKGCRTPPHSRECYPFNRIEKLIYDNIEEKYIAKTK